jgi:hypothetical protein
MQPQQLLHQALLALESADTRLGDRSTYVGSSDIGGCPRKVVLEKLFPTPLDDTARLRLLRGHVGEELIERLFAASGRSYVHQLELIHPEEPFQAHVDFCFDDDPHAAHIVEVKTVNGLPDEPFPSWLDQLQWQIGLFRLRHPRREVRGHVLAIDLNAGAVAVFGPYDPCGEVFDYLLDKGRIIMAAVETGEEPHPSPGLLCGQCPHRDDCPAHAIGQELPLEVAAMAEAYLALNEARNQAERAMKPIKENLLEFAGETFKGHSPHCTVSVSKVVPRAEEEPKVARVRAAYVKLDVRRRAA